MRVLDRDVSAVMCNSTAFQFDLRIVVLLHVASEQERVEVCSESF